MVLDASFFVLKDVTIQKSNKVEIGVQLKTQPPDTRVLVNKIEKKSRAAASKRIVLRDEIIKVNGQDVIGKSPKEVADCLIATSKTGQNVQLRIVRERLHVVKLKRKRPDKPGFGISFYQQANGPLVISDIDYDECPCAHQLAVGCIVSKINQSSSLCTSVEEATNFLRNHDTVELILSHVDAGIGEVTQSKSPEPEMDDVQLINL